MKFKYFSTKTISIHLVICVILLSGLLTTYAKGNVTKEEALKAIEKAEQDMQTMIDEGFSVEYINETLTIAKEKAIKADFNEVLHLEWGELAYEEVIKYTNEIARRKNQAYNISDSITASRYKIQEYEKQSFFGLEIETSGAKILIDEAAINFEEEKYDDAEDLLSEANSNLENEKDNFSALTTIIKLFIFLLSIFVIFFFIRYFLKIKNRQQEMKKLELEKKTITNLMKKAQVDRFEKAKISDTLYKIKMEKYTERLTEIDEIFPILKKAQKV